MKISFSNEAPKEQTAEAYQALSWQEIGVKNKNFEKAKMKHTKEQLQGMSHVTLALAVKEQFSAPLDCFSFGGVQIQPPNTKNDNAAKRQRAAKKRRESKGKQK